MSTVTRPLPDPRAVEAAAAAWTVASTRSRKYVERHEPRLAAALDELVRWCWPEPPPPRPEPVDGLGVWYGEIVADEEGDQ